MEDKKGVVSIRDDVTLSKTQCPANKDEMKCMKYVPYASIIGSIMYVMTCTRPNVAFAISMTNRHQ